jgi:hypothetical protein
MSKLYRIRDWDTVYETAETRKLENLRWVPTPNKHDGLGFRRVTGQKNACELFAAWNLLIQIASKGRKGCRGKLMRDGRALDASDMALMTGFPKPVFDKALQFFSDPIQGWLVDGDDAKSPEEAGESPRRVGLNPAEGKGREGIEGREGPAPAPAGDAAPEIPSADEVIRSSIATNKGIPEDYCRRYHAKNTEQHRWIRNNRVILWPQELGRFWESDRATWGRNGNGHDIDSQLKQLESEFDYANTPEEKEIIRKKVQKLKNQKGQQ